MEPVADPVDLTESQHQVMDLTESLGVLETAMYDPAWQRFLAYNGDEFSREGLVTAAELCRAMVVKNPLIRRGLALRIAYVWGSGVQIAARATGDDAGEQDVNTVVQAFLDDPGNRKVLTSPQASETCERQLGTDGNLFFACFTNPLTGRVQVRDVPFEQVEDVITNPEDATEAWYYYRVWEAAVIDPGTGRTRTVKQQAYYPALGYRPRLRPKRLGRDRDETHAVYWDAPVITLEVNRLKGWKFGIGDVYPAIDWARSYKEFLEDWVRLVKALSRFAWQVSLPTQSKTQAAVQRLSAAPTMGVAGRPNEVGGAFIAPPGATLDAVPKTGATIDSGSGRPVAAMVASALDVPVTMLLADPGVTGARATAETLDRPTELMASMRRDVWTAFYDRLTCYVIDQAVKAPQGPLNGTVRLDPVSGEETVELAGGTDRTVEVTWPEMDELDPAVLVTAITQAAQVGVIPDLEIARMLLHALKVKHVDEILEQVTDGQGNFVRPDVTAGQVAVDAFRNGQDPATVVGDARQQGTAGTGGQ